MLVAKVLLLVGAGSCEASGTPYGGADAGDLGRVEVEEEGGEARGGFAGWGAAGGATGLVWWTVGDPCVWWLAFTDTLGWGVWYEVEGEFLQSCTRSETAGFATMLVVFRLDGFVVMMMTGAELYGDVGRYV